MLKLSDFIIGQSEALEFLKTMRRKAEPPQALLFVGPEGVGKSTLARAFAADWLCLNPQKKAACGECDSCLRIAGENHPDLLVISPSPDQIKIEQIRDLRNRLNFAPLLSPYRAILLERAHLLNLYAANALLKTLEEPPPRTFFLLTAESTDLILPTVLSRCRVLRLGPVKAEEIEAGLQRLFDLSPDRARLLAEYAEGAPGRAIRWARVEGPESKVQSSKSEPSNALATLDALMDLCSQLATAELLAALRLAEEFRDRCKAFESESPDQSTRAALVRGLELLVEWYRDTLALDYGSKVVRLRSRLKALDALRKRFPPTKRLQDLLLIMDTRKAILGNANAQIATEALFIELLT